MIKLSEIIYYGVEASLPPFFLTAGTPLPHVAEVVPTSELWSGGIPASVNR